MSKSKPILYFFSFVIFFHHPRTSNMDKLDNKIKESEDMSKEIQQREKMTKHKDKFNSDEFILIIRTIVIKIKERFFLFKFCELWVRDIETLEQFQRRVTRVPGTLKSMEYESRLEWMSLTSLEIRRQRDDLIQLFKVNKSKDNITW
ncbi:RNA-directed DNA polymerase from mobile element jockey-like [Brachionus plicatilis]|uniref:RNA-directed DNA polymerase from mobile element jockey-like n=1 Tax=Brachionus plicatilis TaxID=10195 RepID=A0A3M7Q7E9_BRAPC|nr:RNA-directed DNA polymerase from mobile element jockey-like [Brachionus plicatilis]